MARAPLETTCQEDLRRVQAALLADRTNRQSDPLVVLNALPLVGVMALEQVVESPVHPVLRCRKRSNCEAAGALLETS